MSLTREVLPLVSLCSLMAVRSSCEDSGVGPFGVGLRLGLRLSIGGGSYAMVVSENFSWATSLAMLAPDRAPQ